MIKPSQKRKIVKAFGKQYSPAIIAILTRSKITNKNGKAFSQESIRKFVNGLQSNEVLEKKIMLEVDKKLLKK